MIPMQSPNMNDAAHSLAYVRDAVATLPDALQTALNVALPTLQKPARTVITTGIGLSEGPARVLASTLAERGIAARFCATSSFIHEAPHADLLVQFSQGLSPNARLVARNSGNCGERVLVTSVDVHSAVDSIRAQLSELERAGFTLIVAPPTSEPNTLVRLIGPTVATLMALRLAAHVLADAPFAKRLESAPAAYRTQLRGDLLGKQPLALITVGVPSDVAYAHRWKLLEALLQGDPPVWDVLQFAHGPLQTFYDKPLTLLILERGQGSLLVPRLVSTLHSARHQVLHVTSVNDDVLSFFEHAAALDALFLARLTATPRNLFDWPARHGDTPLYGLGLPASQP